MGFVADFIQKLSFETDNVKRYKCYPEFSGAECHKSSLSEAPPRQWSITLLRLCLFLSHGKCFSTAAENSVLQVVLNSLKVKNKFIQPRTNNSCRKSYLQSIVLSIHCPYNKCYHDFGGCKEYIFEAMYNHLAVQNPLIPMGVILLNHPFWVKYRWLSDMLYSLMQAEELWYWEHHSKNVWNCTTPLSLQITSVISWFWNQTGNKYYGSKETEACFLLLCKHKTSQTHFAFLPSLCIQCTLHRNIIWQIYWTSLRTGKGCHYSSPDR